MCERPVLAVRIQLVGSAWIDRKNSAGLLINYKIIRFLTRTSLIDAMLNK